MFGTGAMEFMTNLMSGVTSLLGVLTTPPISYFVILGLVAVAAKLVRKFVRVKA